MEALIEIVKVVSEVFFFRFFQFVLLEAARSGQFGYGKCPRLTGGSIKVSLLKKMISLMSIDSPDEFEHNEKKYVRDSEYIKYKRIFNVYTTGSGKDKWFIFYILLLIINP